MTFQEKLDQELKKEIIMPIQRIAEYLGEKAKEDAELAEGILKEEKSLSACYAYIEKQARANAKGNSACFADETVYGWAEDYFKKSEEELNPVPPKKEESAKKEAHKSKSRSKKKEQPKPEEDLQETEETPVEEDDDDDIDLG